MLGTPKNRRETALTRNPNLWAAVSIFLAKTWAMTAPMKRTEKDALLMIYPMRIPYMIASK